MGSTIIIITTTIIIIIIIIICSVLIPDGNIGTCIAFRDSDGAMD